MKKHVQANSKKHYGYKNNVLHDKQRHKSRKNVDNK